MSGMAFAAIWGLPIRTRQENIHRVAEAAKLMLDVAVICLTAFISSFSVEINLARSLVPHGDFIVIHCCRELAICEQRDVKGPYQKSLRGLKYFTGIFEVPKKPEMRLHTATSTLRDYVEQVLALIRQRDINSVDAK
jgi:adenylylsulfate kinase